VGSRLCSARDGRLVVCRLCFGHSSLAFDGIFGHVRRFSRGVVKDMSGAGELLRACISQEDGVLSSRYLAPGISYLANCATGDRCVCVYRLVTLCMISQHGVEWGRLGSNGVEPGGRVPLPLKGQAEGYKRRAAMSQKDGGFSDDPVKYCSTAAYKAVLCSAQNHLISLESYK
jgi:hypothetical protein